MLIAVKEESIMAKRKVKLTRKKGSGAVTVASGIS